MSHPNPRQPRKGSAADPFNLSGLTPRELHARLDAVMNYTREHLRMTKEEEKLAIAIVKAGADLTLEPHGCQSLAIAVNMHAPDLVAAMLKAGADVDARDRGGNSALIRAAAFNKRDMIAVLLAAVPNTSFKDADGRTALDNAIYFDRQGDIIAMLKRGEEAFAKRQAEDAAQRDYIAQGLPTVKSLKNNTVIRKKPPQNN